MTVNPWQSLRAFTPARIAIGRVGGSQPTEAVLNFRLSHAIAKDAVYADFDIAALSKQLGETITLSSCSPDKKDYLLRPDHGRILSADSVRTLTALELPPPDLALIISDGLAAASSQHAPALIHRLRALLPDWQIAPVFLIPRARVKIQDHLGTLIKARHTLILLGERPGLGTPDSLGAYLTARPGPDSTDADRNCVSNIRPEGIPPQRAAEKLAWLLNEAKRLGFSGVDLKDREVESLENL